MRNINDVSLHYAEFFDHNDLYLTKTESSFHDDSVITALYS